MDKKGVSPVIATVLLIAIVVVLAAIIFLWARGFVSERVEKFERDISLSCEDVNFEAGVYETGSEYELEVINRGNVPVYGFNIKKLGEAEILVNEVMGTTIGRGESYSIEVNDIDLESGNELNIVPVILGSTDAGKVAYVCEDRYGFSARV